MTFLKNPSSLLESKRQPYLARYNMHRHPRLTPAIYQVSINGPYVSTGPGESPSRRRIFVSHPGQPAERSAGLRTGTSGGSELSRFGNRRSDAEAFSEDACAEKILSTLMRRAYRRPVTIADLQKTMDFYRRAKTEDGFEAGIEAALSAVLVSPEFLFRIERDPVGAAPGAAYRLSDLALASRLSFFLWSSIPDDGQIGRAHV